jgi:hypothetical protein
MCFSGNIACIVIPNSAILGEDGLHFLYEGGSCLGYSRPGPAWAVHPKNVTFRENSSPA